MTSRLPSAAGYRRQRGSILVNVGAGLSLMVILLGLIDLGFLYYYKREYQKAADLAALAGARHLPTGCNAAQLAGIDSANANLGQHLGTPAIQCGVWKASATPSFTLAGPGVNPTAVRAVILGSAPSFFLPARNLSAEAVATANRRTAALNLRSTIASVNTSKSQTLNALFGNLLGGSVSLSVGAWNGLLNTDVQLLDYLDALAVNLGVQAGNYDALLQTNASVGQLVDAAIDLMEQGKGTGDIGAALGGLELLRAAIPPGTPLLKLGELLAIQSGTETSGLDLPLQVFQMVQAFVQAANSKNAVAATVNLGLANVQVKVLEPPQISAVGDPELARQNPDGVNRIYVRTAQVRTLISVNLPALSGVTGLVNSVLNLLSPVTTLLNNVLSLNLLEPLGTLLGAPYDKADIQVVPGAPRIDISLDAGAGHAKVTNYTCPATGNKQLNTSIETTVADLRIGQLQTNPALPGYVFASNSPPSVGPVPLVDVGLKRCSRPLIILPETCQARRSFAGGGIGLMGQSSVAGAPYTYTFVNPPEIEEEPVYETFTTQNIVNSLASTVNGVQIQMYAPTSGGGLGGLLNLVGAAFNTVKGILEPLIKNLLSPLLDPLVNFLLDTLGLDLAKLEVGGRMSCGGDAALVE